MSDNDLAEAQSKQYEDKLESLQKENIALKERERVLVAVLITLKSLNHHRIDEEIWRIDEVLK